MKTLFKVVISALILAGPVGCAKTYNPAAPVAPTAPMAAPSVVARWTVGGTLSDPRGIGVDGPGNVYVMNAGTGSLLKLSTSGTLLAQWGQEGTGVGQFEEPYGIALDVQGNVYVADSGNQRIQRLDAVGNNVDVVDFSGGAAFTNPMGLVLDAAHALFVTDSSKILKFDANSSFVDQYGTSGSFAGQMSFPVGMAVDNSGILYTVDYLNHSLFRYNPSTGAFAKWGGAGSTDGKLKNPTDVKVDGSGNLYVADYGNNRIQQFDANGNFVRQWGQGELVNPMFIALKDGYLYVTDNGHNRVVKYQL